MKWPLIMLSVLIFIGSCSRERASTTAGYDPDRDPFDDLRSAVDLTQNTGQRILLEVGGEWCKWCHILEKFIQEHEQIRKMMDDNFILIKVNYSQENKNEGFLSRYPAIPGYPHFYVLNSDGSFLHSQGTEVLESGEGYDVQKMTDFLNRWAPLQNGR